MKGLKDLFFSFRYATEGILHAIRNERNLRIHLCTIAYVLFFAWLGEVPSQQIPVLFVCFGLVLCAELFNTVVERLCDLVHPDKHPSVKIIKDVAAAAVLIAAIMVAAAGLWIFLSPAVFLTVISKFFENIYIPILLVISLVLAYFFCRTKRAKKKL